MDDDGYGRGRRPAAKSGKLQVGEQMIIQPKDKDGNVIKTITLTRTERDYVFDLCEAYNNALTREQIDQGLLWIVSNGEVRLVIDSHWSDDLTRRLKQKAEQGG